MFNLLILPNLSLYRFLKIFFTHALKPNTQKYKFKQYIQFVYLLKLNKDYTFKVHCSLEFLFTNECLYVF